MSDPGQAALSGSSGGRGGEGPGGADPLGADPQGDGPPARPPEKFLYPSGSKPLDGFTIKRGVGRGGFGEVYFAASDAGKEVALKLIRRNLDVELRGVRHCLNLKHQNLVDLYDIRTDDLDDQWVVMEYVSGQSLEDAIEAHPNGMPAAEVGWWLRGIAAGVGYLHDHGIVHRDLKPGNIFLDTASASMGEPGVVKIGDYGLSKFISCSRRSGQTESVGTVHYMAPEIANGRYGREIDAYALGVMLYEMLTGHVPFEGESVGEVLMKHLTAEPNLEAIDEPYREIVRRALAKDPDVRLSSVHELVAMLPSSAPHGAQHTSSAQAAGPAPNRDAHQARRPRDPDPRPRAERYAGYDDDPTPGGTGGPRRPAVEEPMYAAFRDVFTKAKAGWHDANMPPLVQGLLIVVGIMTLISTLTIWAPLTIMLAVFYAVYYVVWTIMLKPGVRAHQARRAAAAPQGFSPGQQQAGAKMVVHRPRPRPWKEIAHEQIRRQPTRGRVTQLIGAMLASGALCLLASAGAVTWMLSGQDQSDWQALHLWMSIVTTLGCWSVLLTNSLTEARAEDQAPMRAILLGLGALVGLVAFGLGDGMSLELPAVHDFGPAPNKNLMDGAFAGHRELRSGWDRGLVAPGAAVSMAYFALLMAIPRWWRLAESTRRKRLSLGAVAGLVTAAWLLHFVWWYPQPAGMLVAGVIAASTMLASPWLPPSKRAEMARAQTAV
ncbi:serine/threonine-protein kinase [Posidoniimonas polymericola]|nr:serine/threonine-protein kinase [Posidoniimonas polymericola]